MLPNKSKVYVVESWPGESTGEMVYEDNYGNMWRSAEPSDYYQGTGDRRAILMVNGDIIEKH